MFLSIYSVTVSLAPVGDLFRVGYHIQLKISLKCTGLVYRSIISSQLKGFCATFCEVTNVLVLQSTCGYIRQKNELHF